MGYYRSAVLGKLKFKNKCHKVNEISVIIYGGVKMEDFSDRFKIRMNRVFRERAGIKNIPHPEVDNLYERVRSSIIRTYLLTAHRLQKKIQRK